jgi:hypothetical protein
LQPATAASAPIPATPRRARRVNGREGGDCTPPSCQGDQPPRDGAGVAARELPIG